MERKTREEWSAAIRLGAALDRIHERAAQSALDLLHPAAALPTVEVLAGTAGVPPEVLEGLRVLALEIPNPMPESERTATARARLDRLDAAARAAFAPDSAAPSEILPDHGETGSDGLKTRLIGDSPPDVPLPGSDVPKRLGPYQLLEILGRGGMGAVFRARHEKLGTFCAVKVMLAGQFASGETMARFRREAAAVARLGKHPHIVTVHDLGEEGGRAYYAMDLVEGKSLRACLLEREFRWDESASILEKVARALHFAHRNGIVHRDLKPDNVMIGKDGEPQVMDFGLARDVSSADRLSASGEVMGTLAYMAPEQARGDVEATDARTDVYALGGILYEMLAGVPPHLGKTVAQILPRILSGDVLPPRRFRPDLAIDLETICMKALAFEPQARYATAEALADDLARWRRGEPISARPVGALTRLWMRARRNKAVAVPTTLLALVLIGGLVGWAATALHRRLERDRRAQEAERALTRKDVAAALAAAQAAEQLDPSDPEVQSLLRRARAEEAVARGERAFSAYLAAEREAEALHERRRALSREAETLRRFAERAGLWAAEAAAREGDLCRDARFADAVAAFTEALGHWNGHPTARRRLGDLYWDRYLEAERGRDLLGMASAKALLATLGSAEREADLLGVRDVRVVLRLPATRSDSKGELRAFLHRYVRRDAPPVLVPAPCDRAGSAGSPPASPLAEPVPLSALDPSTGPKGQDAVLAARNGTAYPLSESESNRVALAPCRGADRRASVELAARLPIGSYLLHVPGGQGVCELRYPFTVTREAGWDESCEVPSEDALPPLPPGAESRDASAYWRLVPEGPYRAGGDPDAPTAIPRDASFTRVDHPYFLACFEISTAMYIAYLGDRGWQPKERAFRRLPRSQAEPTSETLFWSWSDTGGISITAKVPAWRPDWPIYFVTEDDIEDYCRWLTERAGAGRWEFSPPDEDEWEKGARGVDGRWFPWGDEFDPVVSSLRGSRVETESACHAEPAGLFPLDESPFGLRDMGGMMYEWTSTRWEGAETSRISKGSGWSGPFALARCAFRGLGGVSYIIPDISARLRARARQ